MPVVPFSAATGGPRSKQREVPAADEPWLLMAAAQMDVQGRLVHPNVEDRRDQGRKETDNRMVEDQQQPRSDYGSMHKDVFGKLSDALGRRELDKAELDSLNASIDKIIAARRTKK